MKIKYFVCFSLLWSFNYLIGQITPQQAQSRFDEIYPIESSDPYEAILRYKEMIPSLNRDIDKGRALSYIGIVYLSLGSYDSLDITMDKALQLFEQEEYEKGIASVHNTIGNAYLYRGFYTEALDAYYKALPYYGQKGQEQNLTVILNNMASMFQHNEDHIQSRKYLSRALSIAKFLKEDHPLANSYNNLSASYTSTGDFTQAFNYADSAWNHIVNSDDNHMKVLIGSNLARTSINLHKIKYAADIIDRIKTFNKGSKDLETEIVISHSEAIYYEAIDDCENAIAYANLSLGKLQEFQDKSYEIDVLMLLRDCSSKLGNDRNALAYAIKLDSVKSESFLAARNRQAIELESMYQNTSKNDIINSQNITLEKQKGQRNLIIGISSVALLLSLFGIYFFKERKRKIEEQLLLQSIEYSNLQKKQQLASLDYIVQGQEEERKRIAQELHDGLGGLLTSIRRQISSIQDKVKDLTDNRMADDAERMISNACDEVRRISHDMMPASLVSLGLQDAIEDLLEDTFSDTSVTIHASLDDCQYITEDKEKVHIYRIIQEIINNAFKHADAKNIHLHFKRVDNLMKITIKDDGVGSDPSVMNKGNGLGLQNIHARVNYLDGQLETKTQSNEGVSYDILIPLSVKEDL